MVEIFEHEVTDRGGLVVAGVDGGVVRGDETVHARRGCRERGDARRGVRVGVGARGARAGEGAQVAGRRSEGHRVCGAGGEILEAVEAGAARRGGCDRGTTRVLQGDEHAAQAELTAVLDTVVVRVEPGAIADRDEAVDGDRCFGVVVGGRQRGDRCGGWDDEDVRLGDLASGRGDVGDVVEGADEPGVDRARDGDRAGVRARCEVRAGRVGADEGGEHAAVAGPADRGGGEPGGCDVGHGPAGERIGRPEVRWGHLERDRATRVVGAGGGDGLRDREVDGDEAEVQACVGLPGRECTAGGGEPVRVGSGCRGSRVRGGGRVSGGQRRELHDVRAGWQVREQVRARRRCHLRGDRVAVDVGGDEGGAVRLVESGGHCGDAGLTGVLAAVAVRVTPHEVADRDGLEDTEVDGGVRERQGVALRVGDGCGGEGDGGGDGRVRDRRERPVRVGRRAARTGRRPPVAGGEVRAHLVVAGHEAAEAVLADVAGDGA